MKKQILSETIKFQDTTNAHIYSANVILTFGVVGIFLPILQFPQIFPGYNETTIYFFRELTSIISLLLLLLISTFPDYFFNAIYAWSIGGFVSSLIFSHRGSNGPIYVPYLLLRFMIGMIPIFFILLVHQNALIWGGVGYILLLIPILLVLSLPLSIVSWISYQVGLKLLPQPE
ncbi:MAG: hypothetical protein ACXAE3_14355 [Candidatus Kariarchaeaceae archaeon]|jgi:hypothetical protein